MPSDSNPKEVARSRASLNRAKIDLDKCKRNFPFETPMTKVGQAIVTVADYTYLFAVDPDGRILYTKWKLGSVAPGWQDVGGEGRTDAAPAATVVERSSYIFMTIKGLDGYIYLNQGQLNPEGEDSWVGWLKG